MMLQQLQCPTFKKVSISLGNLKERLKDALILYNTNGLKRFNDDSVYIHCKGSFISPFLLF